MEIWFKENFCWSSCVRWALPLVMEGLQQPKVKQKYEGGTYKMKIHTFTKIECKFLTLGVEAYCYKWYTQCVVF